MFSHDELRIVSNGIRSAASSYDLQQLILPC